MRVHKEGIYPLNLLRDVFDTRDVDPVYMDEVEILRYIAVHSKLTQEQKDILVYTYKNRKTRGQIAELLGKSATHVDKSLRNAISNLEYLKLYLDDPYYYPTVNKIVDAYYNNKNLYLGKYNDLRSLYLSDIIDKSEYWRLQSYRDLLHNKNVVYEDTIEFITMVVTYGKIHEIRGAGMVLQQKLISVLILLSVMSEEDSKEYINRNQLSCIYTRYKGMYL